jgi:hypothetical protein
VSVSVIESEHEAARHPLHTPAAVTVLVIGAVVVMEDFAQPANSEAAPARASANRIIVVYLVVRFQARIGAHSIAVARRAPATCIHGTTR